MKVVALHTDFRIYWPARLKALGTALTDRGDSLEVIEIAGKGSPYEFAGAEQPKSLKWHILFPESKPEELSGKDIMPVLFELLDSIQPDVILAGAIAFPSGALAVRWARTRENKRVIIFDDAKAETVKRNPVVNFVKQSIYNGVDAMLYPAEPWVATGQSWGFPASKIFFGVDVVDNDFWSNPVNERLFDYEYFVAVGRQIEKKNFLSIVRAYHRYLEQVGRSNALKLVLIGNGPEHDKILRYIEDNQLDSEVKCLEFMSQDGLRGIYQNAKSLILSSSSETWGLVINEAMSCGCAIIASRQCGATSVLVKESINGFQTDCDDLEGLTEAMTKYHSLPPEDKTKMADASRKIISNWNLDCFTSGVVAASDAVMADKPRNLSFIDKLLIKRWYGQYRPV